MSQKSVVRVGVGVIIRRNGKILVGQRKGSHGEGCWSIPGGHLEFGETIEECARREVLEETGLVLGEVKPFSLVTNDIFAADWKHYVTCWAMADLPDDDVQVAANLEPEKCAGWEWHEWQNIPKPHFKPLENVRTQWKEILRELTGLEATNV